MTPTANLFTEAVLIGEDEASPAIVEAQRFDSFYRAILKKRIGNISAEEYLSYARRFVSLCNEIYQGCRMELHRDSDVLFGYAAAMASAYEFDDIAPGEMIALEELTPTSFEELFNKSSSMTLTLRPEVAREDIANSMAQIIWANGRPKTLFFYAQQGGRYDLKDNQRPLHNLLYRKFFYVPGVAPSLNFTVRFGITNWSQEKYGKLK